MSNCPQAMTPASIRYLLVLDDLCREAGASARWKSPPG